MSRREAYRAGLWVMGPPPVCTARWGEDDWIRFVTFTVEVTD